MATIVPRKNDRGEVIGWQAKIRRVGFPNKSETFDTKRAAEDWAKVQEAEMIRGVYVDRSKAERTLFGEIIEGYIAQVAPTHKGAEAEIARLQRFLREERPLCAYSLANLRTRHFEDFMRRRMEEVVPGTVKRELGLLHSVIEWVRKAYGMVENPISDVRRPTVNDARTVRLQPDEEERLIAAIEQSRNPWLKPAVILAIETAARRSELLELRWADVDFDQLKIRIEDSKIDDKRRDRLKGRDVPLSPRAYELLWELGTGVRDPNAALNYENDARNNVEQGRSNLISRLNATADVASTVSSANNQAAALSAPQGYSPLGQMFGAFTSALDTQRRYETTAALTGSKPYINTGLFTPRKDAISNSP